MHYIKHDVAFEYNGDQHYGPTEMYPDEEDAVARRIRDLIKMGLSVEQGITLIVLRSQDLNLERVRELVEAILPLRDLTGHEPLVQYLEWVSRGYRRSAA